MQMLHNVQRSAHAVNGTGLRQLICINGSRHGMHLATWACKLQLQVAVASRGMACAGLGKEDSEALTMQVCSTLSLKSVSEHLLKTSQHS